MNRAAKGERHLDASDASPKSAPEQLIFFPAVSPGQSASFFGSISTAC
jgi:hypothetical protein